MWCTTGGQQSQDFQSLSLKWHSDYTTTAKMSEKYVRKVIKKDKQYKYCRLLVLPLVFCPQFVEIWRICQEPCWQTAKTIKKHGEIKAPNKNSWDVSVQSELQRKNSCGSFCCCWWCVRSDASVSSCLCRVWATACRKAQQPESVSEQQLLVNQIKTVQRNTENKKLWLFSIYSTMNRLKLLSPNPSVVVDSFHVADEGKKKVNKE